MILPDVNVLLHSHRALTDDGVKTREWFKSEVNSGQTFGLADQVIAGFLRVATNPRAFHPPTPLDTAINFINGLIDQPNCALVAAGPRHWELLKEILVASDSRGNIVTDANLAAIALEYGFTIATRNHDFARFEGIRWIDPISASAN